MKILAIETSCDDTCIAVLEIKDGKIPRFLNTKYYREQNDRFQILSNIVSSQIKIHRKYGGVYPNLAKREHQKNLPIVFEKALRQAQGKPNNIDLIAVTNGPGLEPCLWVGINFAKELAKNLKLPIVPVNHIEAHIFSNWLRPVGENSQKVFPAVCLVVSGGHTQLILMKDFGKYKILGETRDDAAGECFDKTARILGLGYPGGPAIAKQAAKYKTTNTKHKIQLPRPMFYHKNYDFSFSGLKTAVLYLVKQLTEGNNVQDARYAERTANYSGQYAARYMEHPAPYKKLTNRQKRAIPYEIQQAVIDVLIHKTLKAAKDYKAKSIILGGGVTANKELRKQFRQRIKKEIPHSKFFLPDSKYCTDNATMVAITGYFQWLRFKKINPQSIEANANLRLE